MACGPTVAAAQLDKAHGGARAHRTSLRALACPCSLACLLQATMGEAAVKSQERVHRKRALMADALPRSPHFESTSSPLQLDVHAVSGAEPRRRRSFLDNPDVALVLHCNSLSPSRQRGDSLRVAFCLLNASVVRWLCLLRIRALVGVAALRQASAGIDCSRQADGSTSHGMWGGKRP